MFNWRSKPPRPAWQDIEMVVTDCDGVLTDDTFHITAHGVETLRFCRADGIAVSILRDCGVRVAVLTREDNAVIRRRCQRLGIAYWVGGVTKAEVLAQKCADVQLSSVCYIGNERADYLALLDAGIGCYPSDAIEADLFASAGLMQLQTRGGHGCLREVAVYIEEAKQWATNR